jgi:hypothetical protein
VPTISMFYGVVIRMYWNDHMPPHFHAYYQDDSAVYDLNGRLLEGELPAKQASFVVAWAAIHHDELLADWELAKKKEEVFRIDPLR